MFPVALNQVLFFSKLRITCLRWPQRRRRQNGIRARSARTAPTGGTCSRGTKIFTDWKSPFNVTPATNLSTERITWKSISRGCTGNSPMIYRASDEPTTRQAQRKEICSKARRQRTAVPNRTCTRPHSTITGYKFSQVGRRQFSIRRSEPMQISFNRTLIRRFKMEWMGRMLRVVRRDRKRGLYWSLKKSQINLTRGFVVKVQDWDCKVYFNVVNNCWQILVRLLFVDRSR